MLIQNEEENRIADNVWNALVSNGLHLAAKKHVDIYRISKKLSENKKDLIDEINEQKRKGLDYSEDLFILDQLVSDTKTILEGWIVFLKKLIDEEYSRSANPSLLSEFNATKALIQILQTGFSTEDKVYFDPNPRMAEEIIPMLDPKVSAFALAQKYARQDGMEGARAKYCLFNMLRLGEGCKKDEREALKYLKEAAKEGLPDANYILGRHYELGIFGEKNRSKYYSYYKKASMCFEEDNPEFYSKEGKKHACKGHPIAQYHCAREEISLENIKFCLRVAEIASGGDDGDKPRYYKATREKKLYGCFNQFLKNIQDAKKEVEKSLSEAEKNDAREDYRKLCEKIIQKISRYSLTVKEQRTLEQLKEFARKNKIML